jgi:hypothetical protein
MVGKLDILSAPQSEAAAALWMKSSDEYCRMQSVVSRGFGIGTTL